MSQPSGQDQQNGIRINKMVNEHTIDYHPSLSELTPKIHPLLFLWTPKGFMDMFCFTGHILRCTNYEKSRFLL